MKELYQKYLYIPKNGKVSEKVMLVRMGLSIGFIVLCLAAMSVSAYAFFSSTVTSQGSVIKSAEYDLEVVSDDFTENDGEYILTNESQSAVKQFSFSIKTTQKSNASVGYAKIILKSQSKELTIYTAPIWTTEDIDKPIARSFTVDVAPESTVIMMVSAQWGSCSSETVAEGGALIDLPETETTQEEGDASKEPAKESDDIETPSEQPSEEQTEDTNSENTPLVDDDAETQPDQSEDEALDDPFGDQSEDTDSKQTNEGSTEEGDQTEQPDQTQQSEQTDQTSTDPGEVLVTE